MESTGRSVKCRTTFQALNTNTVKKQEAQLSPRGRVMHHIIKYFAKSLKVTQGHSKWHHLIDGVRVPIGFP